MHVILWWFDVPESSCDEFERVYGEHVDWAVLFSKAAGFLGTCLMREVGHDGRYMTIDRWVSQGAFDTFRSAASAAYEALDQRCLRLTTRESRLGSFVTEVSTK